MCAGLAPLFIFIFLRCGFPLFPPCSASGRVASRGAQRRPWCRHETCQSAAGGTGQPGPCGEVCASRGGRGDGCAGGCPPLRASTCALARGSGEGAEPLDPGGPPRPEVPASFADNSFVRGSLRLPPPGCGRAAAGSAAAGPAGAVTLRVRAVPSRTGEARRAAAVGARGVGGAGAAVAFAHGEKGRPARAHGSSHVFASP